MPSSRTLLNRVMIERAKPEAKPYRIHDTKVPGLFLRVQPSGAKSWNVAWSRQTSASIGRFPIVTLEAARVKARALLAERDEHGAPLQVLGARRVDRRSTLRQFLDVQYEPWAKANQKSAAKNLAAIRLQFADMLDTPLYQFSPWMAENWRAKRAAAGIAPSTINRDLNRLKGVFSRAVDWKVLTEHPLATVRAAEVDNTGVVRFLSAQEAKALRAALTHRDDAARAARARANDWRANRDYDPRPPIPKDGYADHLTPMVLLALNTGLRRGELTAITWADVDLQAQLLTVRAGYAKAGKARHIPLNAEAVRVLKRWRKQTDGNGRIFALADPKKGWAALLTAAGIENFRFHDLRHDFASRLVMAGVDLNTVRELLGHESLAMTLRYAHLAPEHKRAAVDALGR